MKGFIKACECFAITLFCLLCFNVSANDYVAATLYEDEGLGGDSFQITGDTPSLGDFANKMSSFELNPGFTIRFFLQENFQGGYYSVDQRTYNSSAKLSSVLENVADKVKSVKVLAYGSNAPVAAVIYPENNFSGQGIQLKGDIASLKEFNIKFGSFDIEPGYQIRFFEEENFQGSYYSKGSDAKENADPPWGARISSVQIIVRDGVIIDKEITSGGSGEEDETVSDFVAATLYEDENLSGDSFQILGDTPSLGDFADKMSSFELNPGFTIRFFLQEDFQGGYYSVDQKTYNSSKKLSSLLEKIADQVRSVKVLVYSPETPTVGVVYPENNFSGQAVQLKGDIASLKELKIRFGSFAVEPGYILRFFEEENFQGEFYSKGSDAAEKANPSWGNRISSIKIITRLGESVDQNTSSGSSGGGNNGGNSGGGSDTTTDPYFDLSPPVQQPNIAAGVLYKQSNYKGDSLPIWQDYTRLPQNMLVNVGSFTVNPGYELQFFNRTDYLGSHWTYSSNVPNASNGGNFVSVRVTAKPPKVAGTSSDVYRVGRGSEVVAQLFEGLDYTGARIDMTESIDQYPSRFWRAMGSFKIKTGYEIQFFQNTNFSGTSYSRNSTSNDAAGFSGKNKTTSALIVNSPIINSSGGGGNIVFANLYDGTDYTGARFDMKGDIPEFPLHFDRRMSSWKIPAGYGVRFYDGLNYTGNQWNRLGDQFFDSRNFGPTNKIRSAKVTLMISGGPASNWTYASLYDEPNHQGLRLDVKGDIPVLPPEFDKKMSSFEIPRHYEITFFEGAYFTGKSYVRKYDATDSANFTSANNKIRSMRVKAP